MKFFGKFLGKENLKNLGKINKTKMENDVSLLSRKSYFVLLCNHFLMISFNIKFHD